MHLFPANQKPKKKHFHINYNGGKSQWFCVTTTHTFIVETAGSGSRLFTHVFNLISICSTRESKTNSKREARDSKLLISIYFDIISTHVTLGIVYIENIDNNVIFIGLALSQLSYITIILENCERNITNIHHEWRAK